MLKVMPPLDLIRYNRQEQIIEWYNGHIWRRYIRCSLLLRDAVKYNERWLQAFIDLNEVAEDW